MNLDTCGCLWDWEGDTLNIVPCEKDREEAVVRAPRTIPVIPRIWITIEAELYRGLSV